MIRKSRYEPIARSTRTAAIGASFRFDAYLAANAQMIVFGRFLPESMHAHRSIQMVAALDGPVHLCMGDGRTIVSERLVIPPMFKHRLLAYEGRLVMMSFDQGTHSVSAWAGTPVLSEFAHDAELEQRLRKLFVDGDVDHDAYALMSLWIEAWTERAVPPAAIDPRVALAKRRIDESGAAPVGRRELARSVGLSPSRFAAIFAADTGTSLGRYLVWHRLIKALRLIGYGESVAAAAALTGFSDGAHLARSSRAVFGIPPSRTIGIVIRGGDVSRRV